MFKTLKKWRKLYKLVRTKKLMFHPPQLAWQAVKKHITLPRRFCGACSLREGSAVVVVITQAVFATIAAIALIIQRRYSKPITTWWNGVLQRDYSHWFKFKCVDNSCTNTGWEWILDGLVGVIVLYELFGLTLILALCSGKSHPFFLLPWMIVTGILQILYYASAIFLLVLAFMNSTQRDLSVTMDMAPIVLYLVFALVWTYGYFVVISYFKMKNRKRKAAKAALKRKERKLLDKSKKKSLNLDVTENNEKKTKKKAKKEKIRKVKKIEHKRPSNDTDGEDSAEEIKDDKY